MKFSVYASSNCYQLRCNTRYRWAANPYLTGTSCLRQTGHPERNNKLSWRTNVYGTQLSLYNINYKYLAGLQSGLVNWSKKAKWGAQVGAVNASGKDSLIQFGLVNYSEKKAYLQIGLFNLARENPLPFFPVLNIGWD